MRSVAALIGFVALISVTSGASETFRVPLVPESRVADVRRLVRGNPKEREVVILNSDAQMLVFHLDRRPVASVARGEALRLYLLPGRYRFGVRPTSHALTPTMTEINAEISKDERQLYRIFQSSGFTSSGGNAALDIAPMKEQDKAKR